MKICIYNGKIVTPDSIAKGAIYIVDGKIDKIVSEESTNLTNEYENLNANENWILPGIIDCHSDAVELELQPRPTSLFSMDIAFKELEKKLVLAGITTMYHSLSISKNVFGEEKIKKYYRTEKGVDELSEWLYKNKEKSIINHKLHIRYEIDNSEGIEQLKEMIRNGKVDFFSIMDHTPGQGQFRNLEKYKKVIIAYRNCSEKEAEKFIEKSIKDDKMEIEDIENIIKFARTYNIPVASHDDDLIEKIDLIKPWDVKISEFPIMLKVAKYAKEKGLYTVMGAPNILLGGSHSGNLSAEEAINNNAVDILCSDYYPASLLHSIFYMKRKGSCIKEMVKLISLNPAKALNLDNITGSLENRKNADILIVEEKDGLPLLKNVFSSGKMIMSMGG
ncbi:MAG: alpha-D-ribose 1-methylphosphonate 5-triphosphate diphosphatase [Fusobacteriaceae bacterium]